MTTVEITSRAETEIDHDWEALLVLDEASRERRMTAIFCHLVMAGDEERAARLRSMVVAELGFSDSDLLGFTISRLSSWLMLHHEDAIVIASAYDSVISAMLSSVVRHRAALVQTSLGAFDQIGREALQQIISERVWNIDTKLSAIYQASAKDPIWPYTDELR